MIPWRLAAGLALLAALVAGGWYVKGLVATNALLREQVNQWQVNYEGLDTLWKQERAALSSREAAYQVLAKRNHTLNQKLDEALSHAAQADPCVNTPLPLPVDQRLRHVFAPPVPLPAHASD